MLCYYSARQHLLKNSSDQMRCTLERYRRRFHQRNWRIKNINVSGCVPCCLLDLRHSKLAKTRALFWEPGAQVSHSELLLLIICRGIFRDGISIRGAKSGPNEHPVMAIGVRWTMCPSSAVWRSKTYTLVFLNLDLAVGSFVTRGVTVVGL